MTPPIRGPIRLAPVARTVAGGHGSTRSSSAPCTRRHIALIATHRCMATHPRDFVRRNFSRWAGDDACFECKAASRDGMACKVRAGLDSPTMAGIRIVDVTDEAGFGLIPPCADPRFDHRTCDYWEDADHGSKAARSSWLSGPARAAASSAPASAASRPKPANPFLADLEAAAAAGQPVRDGPARRTRSSRPATRTRGRSRTRSLRRQRPDRRSARMRLGSSSCSAGDSVWQGATRRSSCSTTNRRHTPSSAR